MKMSIKQGQGAIMDKLKHKLYLKDSHNIYYRSNKWYYNIQDFLHRQGRKETLRNLTMLVAETILIFTAISTILIVGLAL